MKKAIIILFFVSILMIFSCKEEDIIIPKEAIRFRVIANSNSLDDQTKKTIIKDKIEQELYSLISNASNTSEVRNIIQENMPKIEDTISKYNIPYNISYGDNYFPTKKYKGIIYNAGNYESLVITLGEGYGNNFWCVLFPPLCLLDNTTSDVGDVEYQLYVKKLLDEF